MLKLLTVILPLLPAPSAGQWPIYAIGQFYALAEYGCLRKEDSLSVARKYKAKGAAEAWKLIVKMGKPPSRGRQAMCMKIDADFVFLSLPILEAEIGSRVGEAQRLSVVLARTAKGNPYWLLMRNSLFAAD